MSNEETKLQQAIQQALCWLPGVEAWALTTARRGKLAFGLRELNGNVSGGADIIGCVDGLLLWCEAKLPGNDIEPGSDQERRLEVARKLGAVAFVAHSVEEAVVAVQRRQQAFIEAARYVGNEEMLDRRVKAVAEWIRQSHSMRHYQCLPSDLDGIKAALKGAS
ncbi:MAG: hypothetical protein ACYTAN_17525 [Planctomycetota bacterium]|jgi:hypothetical protein